VAHIARVNLCSKRSVMTDQKRLTIGVLGGGQLGRMLGQAGAALGMRLRFFDPETDACAADVGEFVRGEWLDGDALRRFADGLAVCTYEFESVPVAAAEFVLRSVPLRPGLASLATAQDRVLERQALARAGFALARWTEIRAPGPDAAGEPALERAVERALGEVGAPGVLKVARGGYDGKGQAVIDSADALRRAIGEIGAARYVYEERIGFDRELSLVGVRTIDGSVAFYPPSENVHVDGMLSLSRCPALGVDGAALARAQGACAVLAEALGHVGVFCVELFDAGGRLLANEMAPRVHNTGHWSLALDRGDGAGGSQFSQHLRAITGMDLAPMLLDGHAGMVNIIGANPDAEAIRAIVGDTGLVMYGKAPRPRRKLGHAHVLCDTPGERDEMLARVLDALPGEALRTAWRPA